MSEEPEKLADRHRLSPASTDIGTVATELGDGGPGAPRGSERGALGLPAVYEDLGPVGSGGMGVVRRVRDRDLDCVFAMKLLAWELVDHADARARFLHEARITAGLRHPGIVAVQARGELADGRPWFTMTEVRGRTLAEVIREAHGDPASPWTPRRMVEVFLRVCEAMAYAHEHGVIHRDLKPDNLMVGEFGEALVMDWGVARRHRARRPDLDAPATGEGLADDDAAGPRTGAGDVVGTPAYMSPEQARGEQHRVGPASDVYSLGAVLYGILSGRAPYEGSSRTTWFAVLRGPPEPLGERPGAFDVPPELRELCEAAMARDPQDRLPGAGALADRVREWLDGARRAVEAAGIVDRADAMYPEIAALRDRAEALEREARARKGPLRPFDPVALKRPVWDLEDQARELGRQAAVAEATWLQTLRAALEAKADFAPAHARLADFYCDRLLAAEAARETEDAARWEALLAAHDDGRHDGVLRGLGRLTLCTEPEGATVEVHRFVRDGRRLVTEPLRTLGPTPLLDVELERGSYLLHLTAPGREPVRYPVLLERGGTWRSSAPGQDAPTPVFLPEAGALEPGDVYVPAGWFGCGGDPHALEALAARTVWVDGFVMRRFPVTNEEYLLFLDDLVRRGLEEEATLAAPWGTLVTSGDPVKTAGWPRGEDGGFVLPAEDEWAPDVPIRRVTWHAAMAYARWYADRTGLPWRLPDELEWEKAARGVDRRVCVWGDTVEQTWARMVSSTESPPACVPVTEYPIDESVYGVRGLTGNVRDWCLNVWRHEGPQRVDGRLVVEPAAGDDPDYRAIRGGAWQSAPAACRAASRLGDRPTTVRSAVGFRLVRSLPAG